MWPFSKRAEPTIEKRSSGSGFTSEILAARASYLSGASGLGELTGTVQSCVSLWEAGLSLADVQGTGLLGRRDLACLGRSLALRGEAVFLIGDTGLVPAVDWSLSTRDGRPVAYRLSVPEAGGGRSVTALAGEVLHVRIGCDAAAPWTGTAPLRRASLTAGMLHAIELALCEVYQNAPLGSAVLPFPETPDQDLGAIGRGFAGKRGKILLRESVQVQAAGGPAPAQDWRPSDLSPDLSRSMTRESLSAARDAICMVFGVLPALANSATTGPMVREAQRHLAQWVLSPIAAVIAEEATQKFGSEVSIDVMRPLQAYDAGGRARALSGIIGALAQAKEAGIDPEQAMALLNLTPETDA